MVAIYAVRHTGQKIQQAVHLANPECVKRHLFYYFGPLSVCTAAPALIRKASDALCSIFQRVIVRYHWGIDKYESNRVYWGRFMWGMSLYPLITTAESLIVLLSTYGVSVTFSSFGPGVKRRWEKKSLILSVPLPYHILSPTHFIC